MAKRKQSGKKKVAIAKGVKVPAKKAAKMKKKQGASNLGRYSKVPKGDFCGSVPGTFPVNTKKRAKSALKLAHNDANPSKVKACVKKKFPSVGKAGSKAKRK